MFAVRWHHSVPLMRAAGVPPMGLLRFKRLSVVGGGQQTKQHLDCNRGCGLLPPPIIRLLGFRRAYAGYNGLAYSADFFSGPESYR